MITLGANIKTPNDEIIGVINNTNIISVNSPVFDRSNFTLPSWGIISNKGSLEFKDYFDSQMKINEFIRQIRNNGRLQIEIFLKNTITGKYEIVSNKLTDTWSYNENNFVINIDLTDGLEDMQDIVFEGISYDARYPYGFSEEIDSNNFTLAHLYNELLEYTPDKFKFKSLSQLGTETQTILSNTFLKYPFINSGTLWSAWEKLAQASLSYIYKEKDGKTNFAYYPG